MIKTDLDYMQLAVSLARKGQGRTSPNPMVGAVVVRSGRVIGQGWHHRCGGPHAEVLALRQAGSQARGATLYVTLEPCAHFGRTPPCVDLILEQGIRKVFVGHADPNPLTRGRSIRRLRRAGIAVQVGLCRAELLRLNAAFLKWIARGQPLVVAKTAQTLDGRIATRSGQSKWITGSAARTWARQLRNDFDAILVGVETVLKDDPRLNAARADKRLKKVVMDSDLRTPLDAALFAPDPADCLIATTERAAPDRVQALRAKGVTVLICPQRDRRVDWGWLMTQLAERQLTSVLIEGGGQVIGSALRERIVDQLLVFIAPLILGDIQATGSVTGLNALTLDQAVRLRPWQRQAIGTDLLIRADVCYPAA